MKRYILLITLFFVGCNNSRQVSKSTLPEMTQTDLFVLYKNAYLKGWRSGYLNKDLDSSWISDSTEFNNFMFGNAETVNIRQ
jgi:hypothetical protein